MKRFVNGLAVGRLFVAGLVIVALVAVPTSAGGKSADDVRAALLRTYVHGVTEALAEERIGRPAVPQLLTLLDDPTFPRRDNVVAFLAHLGGAETTPRLVAALDRPIPLGSPENDRALLIVPEALGRIAGRGDVAALDRLLELVDPSRPLPRGVRGVPRALRDALVEQSVRSLGFTGSPVARARLVALRQSPHAHPVGRDLGEFARLALAILDAGAVDDVAPVPGLPAAPPGARIQEGGDVAHEVSLGYVNHVSVAQPIDDDRVDQVLAIATRIAGKADSLGDTACCLRVSRNGPGGEFGSALDGLSVIDSAAELGQVFAVSAARVKIVQMINYCSGPATNVIGCAPVGGRTLVVVRQSSSQLEAVLWLHEYGHNIGLEHNGNLDNVMHGSAGNGAIEFTPQQCAAHHDPPAVAEAILTDIGECNDADHDSVASGADNCPTTLNSTQADGDRDGVGDACDNCRTDANADQANFDGDSRGDVCDDDDDGDGVLDAVDCLPFVSSTWSAPGAIDDLVADGPGTIFLWNAPDDLGGDAIAYDILRATSPDAFATAVVLSCDDPSTLFADPAIPAVAFYYLVRGVNECGATVGTASDGTDRSAPACP